MITLIDFTKMTVLLNKLLIVLQQYPQEQGLEFQYFSQHEIPSSVASWHLTNNIETSSCLAYTDFIGEVELSEEPGQISCMSPYSGHENYARFCQYEEISYEGHNHTSTQISEHL